MYLLLAVPILILTGAAFCYRRDASFNGLDSNEHPLKALYPLASVLYDIIKKNKKEEIFGNTDVLREIYVGTEHLVPNLSYTFTSGIPSCISLSDISISSYANLMLIFLLPGFFPFPSSSLFFFFK